MIYLPKDFSAAGVPSQVSWIKSPMNDLLSSIELTRHMGTIQSQCGTDPMMQAVKE